LNATSHTEVLEGQIEKSSTGRFAATTLATGARLSLTVAAIIIFHGLGMQALTYISDPRRISR